MGVIIISAAGQESFIIPFQLNSKLIQFRSWIDFLMWMVKFNLPLDPVFRSRLSQLWQNYNCLIFNIMWKERIQWFELGTTFSVTCSQGLQTLGYHLTLTPVWRTALVMYMYNDSSRGVCVLDLFLGIPSGNIPLGNSRWTCSITTDLFSPKTLSEASFLWLKCTRGAHGQNTGKRSKVTNIFEAFYIGSMCLALVTYKAHTAMETHVNNVCSHSCPLPKLFLSYLCRHWGRVHCSSTAAGGSQVQPWALPAGEFGAQ